MDGHASIAFRMAAAVPSHFEPSSTSTTSSENPRPRRPRGGARDDLGDVQLLVETRNDHRELHAANGSTDVLPGQNVADREIPTRDRGSLARSHTSTQEPSSVHYQDFGDRRHRHRRRCGLRRGKQHDGLLEQQLRQQQLRRLRGRRQRRRRLRIQLQRVRGKLQQLQRRTGLRLQQLQRRTELQQLQRRTELQQLQRLEQLQRRLQRQLQQLQRRLQRQLQQLQQLQRRVQRQLHQLQQLQWRLPAPAPAAPAAPAPAPAPAAPAAPAAAAPAPAVSDGATGVRAPSPRASSPAHEFALLGASAGGLWQLSLAVRLWARVARYPWDIEWLESSVLYQAYRVLHGLPTYGSLRDGYLPLNHPPLFSGDARFPGARGGPRITRWPGPSAFACFLGAAGLVVRSMARRLEGRSEGWVLGLLAVGTSASGIPPSEAFYTLIHEDVMALFLAVLLAATVEGHRRLTTRRTLDRGSEQDGEEERHHVFVDQRVKRLARRNAAGGGAHCEQAEDPAFAPGPPGVSPRPHDEPRRRGSKRSRRSGPSRNRGPPRAPGKQASPEERRMVQRHAASLISQLFATSQSAGW